METKKLSAADQHGGKPEVKPAAAQHTGQAESAFAGFLNLLLGNTALAATSTDSLQLAPKAASELETVDREPLPERDAEPQAQATEEPELVVCSLPQQTEAVKPQQATEAAPAAQEAAVAPAQEDGGAGQEQQEQPQQGQQAPAAAAAATAEQGALAAEVEELVTKAQEQLQSQTAKQPTAAQGTQAAAAAKEATEAAAVEPQPVAPQVSTEEGAAPAAEAVKQSKVAAAKGEAAVPQVAPEETAVPEGERPVAPPAVAPQAAKAPSESKEARGSVLTGQELLLQAAFRAGGHSDPAAGAQGVGRQVQLQNGVQGVGTLIKGAEDKSLFMKTAKQGMRQLSANEQEALVEKVKDILKNASAGKSNNSFVVRLDPPELGNMTVKVLHKGGQLYTRIIPESQEVEAMLRNRVPELMQSLTASGISTDNMQVSVGQERSETELFQFSQSFNNSGGGRDGHSQPSTGRTPEPQLLERPEAGAGHAQPGWVA